MDVSRIKCTNAEDLLSNLRSTTDKREARYGDIAFRGQRDANWSLVPSAFRPQVRLGYGENTIHGQHPDISEQSRLEYLAVFEFLKLADTVGLPIPGDSQLFRGAEDQRDLLEDFFWQDTWPPSDVLKTLAIAQHHGVPTRLLDFTWEPFIGAFFAAWDALQHLESTNEGNEASPDAHLAIWTVDLRFIRRVWQRPSSAAKRIREVTVPRAPNRFLHAQHGLFLLDTGASKAWNKGSCPPIEDVICESADYWEGRQGFWSESASQSNLLPPVIKIEAPISCARDVLLLLGRQGLTLGHLMPSYNGVVEALKMIRALGIGHAP